MTDCDIFDSLRLELASLPCQCGSVPVCGYNGRYFWCECPKCRERCVAVRHSWQLIPAWNRIREKVPGWCRPKGCRVWHYTYEHRWSLCKEPVMYGTGPVVQEPEGPKCKQCTKKLEGKKC